jgi:hypothetical protein
VRLRSAKKNPKTVKQTYKRAPNPILREIGGFTYTNIRKSLFFSVVSLPARGRVDLEVHRCLCIMDSGNVFIYTFTFCGYSCRLDGVFAKFGSFFGSFLEVPRRQKGGYFFPSTLRTVHCYLKNHTLKDRDRNMRYQNEICAPFNASNIPKEERLRTQCGCLGNVGEIIKI